MMRKLHNRFYHSLYRWGAKITFFFLLGFMSFCGSQSKEVALLISVDQRALIGPLGEVSLDVINGIYYNCNSRYGAWSTAVGEYQGELPNGRLSILPNDLYCYLYINSVVLGSTTYTASSGWIFVSTYVPYLSAPVAFTHEGATGNDFYATAKMTPSSETTPSGYPKSFTLEFVLSSAPIQIASNTTGTYQVVSPTVPGVQIPAPNYLADVSTLSLQFDRNGILKGADGYGIITYPVNNSQLAEYLVITSTIVGEDPTVYKNIIDTFDQALTKYQLDENNIYIPASFLIPIGIQLSAGQTYTVYTIFQHTDPSSHVRSFQVIVFSFPSPLSAP